MLFWLSFFWVSLCWVSWRHFYLFSSQEIWVIQWIIFSKSFYFFETKKWDQIKLDLSLAVVKTLWRDNFLNKNEAFFYENWCRFKTLFKFKEKLFYSSFWFFCLGSGFFDERKAFITAVVTSCHNDITFVIHYARHTWYLHHIPSHIMLTSQPLSHLVIMTFQSYIMTLSCLSHMAYASHSVTQNSFNTDIITSHHLNITSVIHYAFVTSVTHDTCITLCHTKFFHHRHHHISSY